MRKKVLSDKMLKEIIQYILVPIVIMLLSISVLSQAVPKTKFIKTSIESVEGSQTTVLELAGATTGLSLAISAIPDDVGTPIANNLASMSKVLLIVFAAVFVEKIILVSGIKLAFIYVIPLACILYIVSFFIKRHIIQAFANKIAILGLALILVVPFSVKLTNEVGSEYLAHVDQIIAEANNTSATINDETADADTDSILDKLVGAFKAVADGVQGIFNHFKDIVKQCMSALVVLIFSDLIMPVVTLLMFRWILKELFNIVIPTAPAKDFVKAKTFKEKTRPEKDNKPENSLD